MTTELDRRYRTCLTRCRTRAQIAVAGYLYACARRHGSCSPSRAQIAERTGLTERTVTRATTALEAAGCLTVCRDEPYRLKDGTYRRGRTNLYRFRWPPRYESGQNPWSHRGDICVTSKLPTDAVVPAGTGRRAARQVAGARPHAGASSPPAPQGATTGPMRPPDVPAELDLELEPPVPDTRVPEPAPGESRRELAARMRAVAEAAAAAERAGRR